MYPDAYANEAQGEIHSLDLPELLSGICTVRQRREDRRRIANVRQSTPGLSRRSPKIKNRIAQIRSGKSPFRFNCHG